MSSNGQSRSLSVVTVSPEIQSRLEKLSTLNSSIFPIGGAHEDDIEEHYPDSTPSNNYRRGSIKPPTVETLPEDDEFSTSSADSVDGGLRVDFQEIIESSAPTPKKTILKKPKTYDDMSIGDCSIAPAAQASHHGEVDNALMNHRLFRLLSVLYGLFVGVSGVMLAVGDMPKPVNNAGHLFGIITNIIGLAFLGFVHFDIQRHKSFVMNWQRARKEQIEAPLRGDGIDADRVSVTTAIIFNRTFQTNNDDIDPGVLDRLNGYKFQTGKHASNFYLKIGMTLFCMGSIVHQGVSFVLQMHFYVKGVHECQNSISLVIYTVRCVTAFYQLYIGFKYSNLIINRHKTLAMFGFMHMLGTALSFWFATIVEEAMEGYTMKTKNKILSPSGADLMLQDAIKYNVMCQNATQLDSVDNWPYLYPFSIEYNIILASVYYILWSNIGNQDAECELPNVQEEIETDHSTGAVDLNYRSNVTISADCHASNVGLFSGLLSLLVVLVSGIVFFSTITNKKFHDFGVGIYTFQYGILTVSLAVAIVCASLKLRKLNVSKHLDSPASSMDDFLLILPLPFYLVHHGMCIYSNFNSPTVHNVILALLYIIDLLQVFYQTPFLIDGIRRCSNERMQRFKKPAKGLVTFAIIVNVSFWILGTFEVKSVDKYHTMAPYYGKFVWMIILDSCLPLMLFYRFHSSVCLSDIWKNAYEKDEHH